MLGWTVRIPPANKNGGLGFLLLSTDGHIGQFHLLHSVLGKELPGDGRGQGSAFEEFSVLWVVRLTHMTQKKNN